MDKKDKESGLGSKVALLIVRFKYVFIGIIAALIVAAVVVVFVQVRGQGRANSAALQLSEVESLYELFVSELDEAKKADLLSQLREAIAKTTSYGGTFAAQKAWLVSAQIAMDAQDWSTASDEFLKAWQTGKKTSYLSPIALLQSAAAAEEAGNLDLALERYKAILAQYPDSFPGLPRVHFSLGRILEKKEDWAGAKAAYDALALAFPGDDWTNLANSRIIFLKIQGLAQ